MKFKFAFFAVLIALVSSLWAIDGAFAASGEEMVHASWQAGDGSGQAGGDLDKDIPGEVEEFAHIERLLPLDATFGFAPSRYDRERPREVSLPQPLKPPSVS